MHTKKKNISRKNKARIQQWLNQAVHFQLKKDFVASEALIQQVLALDAHNAAAYHYLGLIAKELHSLEAASALLEQSIQWDRNNAEACYHYGIILSEQRQFSQAIQLYQQAIHINKNMDEAWFNLAIAYSKNHEPEKVSSTLTSFFRIPNHTKEVYPNIAKLYFDIGAFEQGIEFCHRCLAQSKPSEDIIWTYINIIQCQSTPEAMFQTIQPYLKQHYSPELMMRIQTYHLIVAWQLGDIDTCKEILERIHPWHPSIQEHAVNISLRSYQVFIGKLVQYYSNNPQSNQHCQKDIYLVGDSHSLSNSNQVLTFGQQHYHAVSKLLIGCKIFHLAQHDDNKFKSACTNTLRSIPDGSSIIMMLGEIDCRADEGFLPAFQRKGGDLSQLIERTVSDYIAFLAQETRKKHLEIYIYGVPAPKLLTDIPNEDMELLKQIIQFFNQVLQHYALQEGYKFIDIYHCTVREDGISHERYHIDGFHLLPKVMEAADVLFINTDV